MTEKFKLSYTLSQLGDNVLFLKCLSCDQLSYFSNSLAIHKEITKEIDINFSVWKSDEKLLIFAADP